uniref:hypothetical protein n=1 Tax=uncultured Sphingomonas sp. TaxID=158754 RepID=UPI0025EF853D|nr:hypothetical protein [uncultured Sphingomonas sp.]
MEQAALTIAALLIVATMCVHSILGQRRLIRPLLDQSGGIMQRPLARFIVPFAWHLTSLIGLVLAAILFAWAWAPESARSIGLALAGAVFSAAGIWDAIGSRGQHVGWPPLTLIGLACLAALILS